MPEPVQGYLSSLKFLLLIKTLKKKERDTGHR
ncbi:hypothetical protein VC_2151 [Vibrio cholerae O1 biovar El Tor str. N16961]|uniref:Uncharacterized protein n=2 Tax=Vibrio cholerae TaxID=666 RepID=Q9KQ53_VIBCH|nr:hypothetical protein VC_2151 [Vibrio cholerae O1 biovar El Tor str. N16961]ACP06376.1 conserved hypothetical protein [Vibrio cholerae M66-2]ACP10257.1 conserved hypothetical protein [Vibrio cholerae O395]